MFQVRLEPRGVAHAVLCSQTAVSVAETEPTGPDGERKRKDLRLALCWKKTSGQAGVGIKTER